MKLSRGVGYLLLLLLIGAAVLPGQSDADREEWMQLFNGRDLEDWAVKINGYELNDNFGNTFRVEDGLLKVAYDEYRGEFGERFGHIFHRRKFSHYIVAVEYRFVNEQAPGGPAWARRNSGIMGIRNLPRAWRRIRTSPSPSRCSCSGASEKENVLPPICVRREPTL